LQFNEKVRTRDGEKSFWHFVTSVIHTHKLNIVTNTNSAILLK